MILSYGMWVIVIVLPLISKLLVVFTISLNLPKKLIIKLFFIDAQRKLKCPENYVLIDSYEPCAENTCENLRINYTMPCDVPCVRDVCVCQNSLYRNKRDECVIKEQCDIPCE